MKERMMIVFLVFVFLIVACVRRTPVVFENRLVKINITDDKVLEFIAQNRCKITKCFYSFGDEVKIYAPDKKIKLDGNELQVICEIRCDYTDDVFVSGFKSSGIGQSFIIEEVGSTNCDFLVSFSNDGTLENAEEIGRKFGENLLKED